MRSHSIAAGLIFPSLALHGLELRPLPSFGAEVLNFNVTELARMRLFGTESEQTEAQRIGQQMRETLHRERLLALRGQGEITWQHQLVFTELLGKTFNESKHNNRKKHPAIPNDHISVFSNDPAKGLTSVGVEGWHVDGNVVSSPHAATLIHAVAAVPDGDTFFAPLREAVQELRSRGLLRGQCTERAPPCANSNNGWVNSGVPPLDDLVFRSGTNGDVQHPLIYPHPSTGEDTMLVALGSLSGRYSRGCLAPALPTFREVDDNETERVLDVVHDAIMKTNRVLRWRWAPGDLLIPDNLAVAHHASSSTQQAPEEVGLRLMRRTTVTNERTPKKRPILHSLPHECVAEVLFDSEGSSGGKKHHHHCMFSLASLMDYQPGKFDSTETARQHCRILSPLADLAMPTTPMRNTAAGHVVSSVGLPHWLGGVNEQGVHVVWYDGKSASTSWGLDGRLPWHEPSGQPNDCDGPGSEQCMFMGPDAKWFDFACQPKVPLSNGTKKVTAGPEITWEDGVRHEYNIYPLCSLDFYDNEAVQLGLRMS
mmetsp:Transcript_134835/g.262603  ORF Transcript_134835/g.262603 Transcript_134835/m.262603 type:complete len:539 (+) Transcript_134835:39-1655(+)